MLNSFVTPEIEVVLFEENDVVTASVIYTTVPGGGIELPDDNW